MVGHARHRPSSPPPYSFWPSPDFLPPSTFAPFTGFRSFTLIFVAGFFVAIFTSVMWRALTRVVARSLARESVTRRPPSCRMVTGGERPS